MAFSLTPAEPLQDAVTQAAADHATVDTATKGVCDES